jgi:hypothetical protein
VVDPDPAGIGTYLVSAVLLTLGIALDAALSTADQVIVEGIRQRRH